MKKKYFKSIYLKKTKQSNFKHFELFNNKLIKFILNKLKRIFFDFFVIRFNKKNIFEKIYKSNYWGSSETRSGPGSDLKNTQNIIHELPKIILKYKIQKVLDIPCGDFNWMKKVLYKLDIDYLGCDIVNDLININKKLYSSEKIKFTKLNLIKDKLPYADLLICRALFFHLDFSSINKILINLRQSNLKYVLLTNCPRSVNYINQDIPTGQYRDLDLFKPPLFFPNNYLYKFKDVNSLDLDKVEQEMILWKKDDLINKLQLN